MTLARLRRRCASQDGVAETMRASLKAKLLADAPYSFEEACHELRTAADRLEDVDAVAQAGFSPEDALDLSPYYFGGPSPDAHTIPAARRRRLRGRVRRRVRGHGRRKPGVLAGRDELHRADQGLGIPRDRVFGRRNRLRIRQRTPADLAVLAHRAGARQTQEAPPGFPGGASFCEPMSCEMHLRVQRFSHAIHSQPRNAAATERRLRLVDVGVHSLFEVLLHRGRRRSPSPRRGASSRSGACPGRCPPRTPGPCRRRAARSSPSAPQAPTCPEAGWR